MNQMRSLRWLWVGVVVCLVICAVVLLLGTSTVEAQTDNYEPVLNNSGDPDTLRIGQSKQNIRNIEILHSSKTDKSSNFILYINLASIESNGIDTSSASLSVKEIQNGSVINTSQLETENTTLLAATIRANKSSKSIHIDSVQVSGINTTNAQISRESKYRITVTSRTDTTPTDFTDNKSTSSFQIVDGNIQIHDQATGSTQLHQDTRTALGVTIDNLSGNTNSTLFITKGSENDIIGLKQLPRYILKSNDQISVHVSNPGGDVNGFLISNSTLGTSDYDIGERLPTKMANRALSSDTGRIVNANLRMTNRSYKRPQTEKIMISRAKVSDTIKDETPFLISLHPVNSTGHIRHNQVIANSRVLTGWNENIPLYFNHTNRTGIFHSNRYAAAIQLAHGHSAGDWVSSDNSEFLRNSDLNQQFVSDGVADGGVVVIKSVRTNGSDPETVQVKRNRVPDMPVYSGQTIQFNSSLNAESVELHKMDGGRSSFIASVGTRLNNSKYVGYNTSVLSTGTYYIHSNREESEKFRIIGEDSKGITLNSTPNESKYGSHARITLSHRVPSLDLIISDGTSNTTTTLKLTTTDTGPTPVRINTYASPKSPSEFVTTGTGVSVESITGGVGSLTPGTYDLTLRSEHGTEVANDTATVTVKPRSTTDLTAYTTRAVAPGGFENATAVREAIADGTLARAAAATANDTVVYAVNATGLTGLPATANESLERGADLDRLDGLAFGVAPAETDDGNESSSGDALGRIPDEAAVHLDRDGLYLVVGGDRAFGTETLPDAGETFEAAFRVDDGRLRRTAAQDRHRVSTGLTYVADPTGEEAETASVDGSTEATVSAESGPSDSSGPSVASGASDGPAGGGSHGGSSSGTGSTGGPSGPGSAAGPTAPDDAGNATGMGGLGGSDGPLGSDGGRSTPPGVGVSIPPGTSEIPPSARPATLSGTGGLERDADGSAASEPRSENGRANDGERREGGDATAVEPAESAESSEPSAAGERPSNEADASDLDYDEAPIRSTAYDLPGFGAVASLAALTGASLLARRRGRGP